MKLTGQKVQQICDALIDAYPTRDLLRILVRIELDENLEAIAGGENQSVAIFNLVAWAERNARVDDLITRAYKRTPGNAALGQLAAEWRAQTPPGAATQIISPLTGAALHPSPASIDVFLSYSRHDGSAMRQVQETLRERGLSVWTDEGLEPGTQSWQDAITEAVRQAAAMVVLLSPNSAQSTWVKNEIGFAQTLNKRVFPVLIAGDAATAVPIALITAQWVDGRQNLNQAVVQELLPPLLRRVTPPAPEQLPPPASERQAAPTAPAAPAPAATAAATAAATDAPSAAATPTAATSATTPTAVTTPAAATMPLNPAPQGTGKGGPPSRTLIVWLLGGGLALAVGLFATAQLLFPPQPAVPAPAVRTSTPAQGSVAPAAETPVPEAGSTRTNIKDGAEYVYVPAGDFKMGSDPNTDSLAQPNEQPQHTQTLPSFWIMRTEVTHGQYKRCVDEGVCTEPGYDRWNDSTYMDRPVHVTWHQANAYAAWAGGRLPTEAEWEKACRGTDGRIYPWDDSAPTAELANFDDTAGYTTPVGQYSPQGDSPYGLVDMAGNVWEWTSSRYGPYPFNAADGRENPDGTVPRTLRGGAWSNDDHFVRCAGRFINSPDYWNNDVGFRVVSPGS